MKLLIVGLMLLSFGLYIYGAGYHNVDLGWNIMVLNDGHNLQVSDYSAILGWQSGSELVGLGYLQQDIGLGLGLTGSFIAGIYAHRKEPHGRRKS